MTAGGVQVQVRYYTTAYVRIGAFVFRHHFEVPEIVPDMVLGLPWLRSYNPTVNWEERYADVRHGSTSYRSSFDGSRDSTRLQFQATSRLELLSTLSSSPWKVAPVRNPASPAGEDPDLHTSTCNKSDVNAPNDFDTEARITEEECIDMEIKYISPLKLKREILRADLTGDQVYLCCMPRPAVPVDHMHSMQSKNDDGSGLDQVRQKLPTRIHKWASL